MSFASRQSNPQSFKCLWLNTMQEKDIDMSYSSKGVKAGQTGQLTRVMMNGNSLYFSSIFHTFLHLLDNG